MKTRIEHDLLGEREVPADAYYGVHTLRALENFPISKIPISTYPNLIKALACVKQACALANHELGLLDDEKTKAIVDACKEIIDGKLNDQFVVDVIQGGAGTSTNMNANEVIANRALELLGCERGDYKKLHPLEDVNMSQSTNDVYPTAVKVALRFKIDELIAGMEVLRVSLRRKSRGIQRCSENGTHPIAGCRADDSRSGIQHVRGDARRRPAEIARSGFVDSGNESRRDRHRHGDQRPPGLRRAGSQTSQRRDWDFNTSPLAIWWKPHRMLARSCNSLAC